MRPHLLKVLIVLFTAVVSFAIMWPKASPAISSEKASFVAPEIVHHDLTTLPHNVTTIKPLKKVVSRRQVVPVPTPPRVIAPLANDEIHTIIAAAAIRWNVNIQTMFDIASCESSFDPHASNGSHGGLFQQAYRYWQGRVNAYNAAVPTEKVSTDIYSPTANSMISARMMAQTGFNDWAQCL